MEGLDRPIATFTASAEDGRASVRTAAAHQESPNLLEISQLLEKENKKYKSTHAA